MAMAAEAAQETLGCNGRLGCKETTGLGEKGVIGSLDLVSRVLFPTPESSYTLDDFPGELIWVPRSLNPQTCTPEECVPCIFLISPSSRFLIFYLHSNAEDLGRCYPFCALLRYQFQVHVLAVEYPGYGLCPGGQADEESVTANAFLAFRFIREVLCWPLDGILILGRSVGTGPALTIAMQQEVYGVILVSPFLSVQEVCRDVVGPLAYLINDRFPNKDRVPKLRSPLLVVHGRKDSVVPVSHGEKLYQLCRSRKRLVCPETMQHNTNLHSDANFFVMPMLQFFSLPDYCFEELKVPLWAYDKRLSIYYNHNTMDPRFSKAHGHDDEIDEDSPEEAAWKKMVSTNPVLGPGGIAVAPAKNPYAPNTAAVAPSAIKPAGPLVSPRTPSPEEIHRRQLEGAEGGNMPQQPQPDGEPDGDVAEPMPTAIENAALAANSKFQSSNGLSAEDMHRGYVQMHHSQEIAPALKFNSFPVPEKTLPSREEDLPEPALEGQFVKVPNTRRNIPAMGNRSTQQDIDDVVVPLDGVYEIDDAMREAKETIRADGTRKMQFGI